MEYFFWDLNMIFFSSGSNKILHYSKNFLDVHTITKRPYSAATVELTDGDLLQAALDQSPMNYFRFFQPAGDAHAKLRDLERANGDMWVSVAHSKDFLYAIEVLEAEAAARASAPSLRAPVKWVPPLHAAVKEGDLARVQQYLGHKHAIQMSVLHGDTPLMLAIRGGHMHIAQALLHAGADSNAVHDRGLTPLMQAAEMGNGSLVRLLVEHGADVNAIDGSWMPALIFAARHGHVDAVKALVEAQANVNATLRPVDGCRGYSALMLAAKNGHLETVKELLQAHADKYAVDIRGNTSLMFAVQSKNVEVVKALLPSASNVDAANAGCVTALMMAARSKQVDIVRALLQANARVDIVGRDAEPALTHARGPEVRALLLEAQDHAHSTLGSGSLADIAIRFADAMGSADEVDASALSAHGAGAAHAAGLAVPSLTAGFGHMHMVDNLLKNMQPLQGTRAAIYDRDVMWAIGKGGAGYLETMVIFGSLFINDYLLTAIRDGDAAGVDTLLRAGADANFKFAWQTTPLMIATHLGHGDIVETLLAAGANVDAVSAGGHAALLYAIHAGNSKIVEILINAQVGIEIERGNKTGLLVSVPGDHEAMARKLLQAKVDTASLNELWKTAQAHADEQGHADIARMLAIAREKIGFPEIGDAGLQMPAQGIAAAAPEQTQPVSAEPMPAAAVFLASLADAEIQPMHIGCGPMGSGAATGHADEAGFLDAASTHAFDGGDSNLLTFAAPIPSALGDACGAAQAYAMEDVPDVQERNPASVAHPDHPPQEGEPAQIALPPFAFGHATFM